MPSYRVLKTFKLRRNTPNLAHQKLNKLRRRHSQNMCWQPSERPDRDADVARSKTLREEPPKQQEPESGSLPGSMGRNWVQLAADIGRPRHALTIPIRRYPFGEARRVAPVIFMDHSSSPPTVTVIPATMLATFPAAMQARTVISTNDDAVRIGSGRYGNDGRKCQSYSKDDFFHGALPEVIGPRLNDCPVFAFHQKTHFGLQSEGTSDHWRTCGIHLRKPGRQ